MKNTLAFLFLAVLILACNKSDDYYKSGKAAFDKGDYKLAITKFDTALQLKPENANAIATRGSARFNIEDYEGLFWIIQRELNFGQRMIKIKLP
jgi:tetratricopeptide (TPR) repeat protein